MPPPSGSFFFFHLASSRTSIMTPTCSRTPLVLVLAVTSALSPSSISTSTGPSPESVLHGRPFRVTGLVVAVGGDPEAGTNDAVGVT